MSTRIIETLQERLKHLGYYGGGIDDSDGPMTQQAVIDFKAAHGLLPRSYVGPLTLTKLIDDNAHKKQPAPTVGNAQTTTELMPPWMAELHRRMGLHEIRNNAALIDFLKIGRFLGNPRNLPWCGDAVESALLKALPDQADKVPKNPFWAQGWKDYGIDVGVPLVGSIGVIRWNAKAGHVGFVAGVSDGYVYLLGGNQNNAINIAKFPASKFIAYCWPADYAVKIYPPLKGQAIETADYRSTR